MFPEETTIQKYHILVRITQDHHVTEWSGNLSITRQADGETGLDISFAEYPESWDARDVSSGCVVSGKSPDTFEFVHSAIP
ncbi:MAG TPA: hypothetical protein VLD65_04425 [Anaerolineales bacterium]|nr:hypothetical protein [Anaerolineales bacterium]